MSSATLRVRGLREGDYAILGLLAQLTVAPDVPLPDFEERVREMAAGPERVLVVEDGENGPLVACGTLLVERKLARGLGRCGHVEDVVVDSSVRGRGVGRLLLDALVAEAQKVGCYKVILDCSEENAAFYAKCGFARKEVQMAKYLV